MEDNNRKWRCQVNTKEETGVVFVDFMSTFLFESSLFPNNLILSTLPECPFHLPITRILLFVVLTVLMVVVGVLTWRKNTVRTSAAERLRSVSTSVGF